jgi:hypothetical protein
MRVIDLSGPDGNAYSLMAMARSWGRQIGMEKVDIDRIISEMTSGDYEHLLEVFEKYFGSIVELRR